MEMPMMSAALKEGYLIKKYHHRHRWKTRWFVLSEDRLAYFKKRDRQTAVGSVHLSGAAVSFPVPGYEKREGVFVLNLPCGREVLLRAPTNDDRKVWTHAIGAVIRATDGIVQMESPSVARDLSRKLNLSDLVGAMQDPDAGIPLNKTRIDDVDYFNCFNGVDAVDWLIRWSFSTTRADAVVLAQELLRLAHIQLVKGPHKQTLPADCTFVDCGLTYFRFSHHDIRPSNFLDSSTDSGSSDGSLSEGDILETGSRKDHVCKQGFLMKRGHLRNKWKSRRVVLSDRPPRLAYYSTSKDIRDPLKVIHLGPATTAREVHPAGGKESGRQFVFALSPRRPGAGLVLLQAEDDHERRAWLTAIRDVTSTA